jgi:hypothetical protein
MATREVTEAATYFRQLLVYLFFATLSASPLWTQDFLHQIMAPLLVKDMVLVSCFKKAYADRLSLDVLSICPYHVNHQRS